MRVSKEWLASIKEVELTTKHNPVLGILRLDYNYPAAPGDIDHPGSFNYEVCYRVIPGLTFEMCQTGALTDEVKSQCIDAVRFLESQNVSGITGDCGFMINIQELVKENTNLPVFLSCLIQLPSIVLSLNFDEEIAIFTANSDALEPIEEELDRVCNLPAHDHRLKIVGCQDVPGFEAVAEGKRVDVEKVEPGIIDLTNKFLEKNPNVGCILLECTELPAYANALRDSTGLPVYDAISNCDAFMSGFFEDKRFGRHGWQATWDGKQSDYHLGDNLST